MPKKHAPAYTQTKGSNSYVHPSLQSSRPPTSAPPEAPQTVNQRIQQLRREQAPRATSERRDEMTESVRTRTLPPQLRHLLQLPEVNAPNPKAGVRARQAPGLPQPRRAPPGPAAPSSWLSLSQSRYAPAHVRNRKLGDDNSDSGVRRKFCTLWSWDGTGRLPPRPSLVHTCLKVFATHWEELIEYEQHYIAELPPPLKQAMMAYLSVYGAPGCLDSKSFNILFPGGKEAKDGNGSEDIQFLDLTSLLSCRFTVNDLAKLMTLSPSSFTKGDGDMSMSSSVKGKAPVHIADSWEDEADDNAPFNTLPSTLIKPIFPHLTRLSLGHPGVYASWADLLALAPKLNLLTHLSLAYWPIPSMTPNADGVSMVSKHIGPIAYGALDVYDDLHTSYTEAASILRRLSRHTYNLRWLDLEGCTWHRALTLGPGQPLWSTPRSTAPCPDWTGAWGRVEYLNVSQGWFPKDEGSIVGMPSGMMPVQLLEFFRANRDNEQVQGRRRKANIFAVEMWFNRENAALGVKKRILEARRFVGKGNGPYCKVDFGWEKVWHKVPAGKEKEGEREG
ncbi:hypothetical protein BCR34DRAFT_475143 [Clohesyomyces aquaticus]|uniref:Tafazzin n=1 Tax=Clohesyomyces aquaticus TaxID=1231657 RepID=A0A1Y2A419_9PLEO|nr:hypothetical protein BCR34DRAFT_475143 [Clohesyomyces aquaticus]